MTSSVQIARYLSANASCFALFLLPQAAEAHGQNSDPRTCTKSLKIIYRQFFAKVLALLVCVCWSHKPQFIISLYLMANCSAHIWRHSVLWRCARSFHTVLYFRICWLFTSTVHTHTHSDSLSISLLISVGSPYGVFTCTLSYKLSARACALKHTHGVQWCQYDRHTIYKGSNLFLLFSASTSSHQLLALVKESSQASVE